MGQFDKNLDLKPLQAQKALRNCSMLLPLPGMREKKHINLSGRARLMQLFTNTWMHKLIAALLTSPTAVLRDGSPPLLRFEDCPGEHLPVLESAQLQGASHVPAPIERAPSRLLVW
jgi:hypothetical protein